LLRRRQLRQAEVENLQAAIARDEDVLRFQIAMHDPFLVRGGESVRDLSRVFDRLANGNARAALVGEAVADLVAERLSFEQLHNYVRGVVVRADVIDRDEVRMIQRAGRTRLDLEAMQPVGIARDELRKNL